MIESFVIPDFVLYKKRKCIFFISANLAVFFFLSRSVGMFYIRGLLNTIKIFKAWRPEYTFVVWFFPPNVSSNSRHSILLAWPEIGSNWDSREWEIPPDEIIKCNIFIKSQWETAKNKDEEKISYF